MARNAGGVLFCLAALTTAGSVRAEPYLAVAKGMHCSMCHSHPAGGGLRNLYGNVFAQSEMAANRLGNDELWTGEISKWLAVGGDLRTDFRYVDIPNADSLSTFNITRASLYAEVHVIANRLSLYLDQQVAPGGSLNHEAYIRLNTADRRISFMAGQFFLPYGLRLQDNGAFIRLNTGVNLINSDRGVQIAYESGPWSTQLALTNGNGGGAETDKGKQISWIGNYVRQNWRAGLSFSFNDRDSGNRQMQNIFVGLRTGPIAWLAEVDLIRDDVPVGDSRDSVAGLIEGNWLIARGNNLKVSFDYFDPDNDLSADERTRWSVVWEYTPIQFLQGRIGMRIFDGLPQVGLQNRSAYFAQLHGFF